jgi:hypothetical protein
LNLFVKGDRPHPPVGSSMAEIGSKTVDVFSWFMNRQTSELVPRRRVLVTIAGL